MVFIYYGCVLFVLILYLKVVLTNLRQGLLVGLVFTTFTLGALPWEAIPLNGVAFGTQLMFIFLAAIYFLARKERPTSFFLNKYTMALMALAFIMIIYLLVSENITYGIYKTAIFIAKGILPVLALGALAPLRGKDNQLIFWTIVIGSVLVAIKLYAFGDIYAGRATFGDSNPITVARSIGVGVTLLSCYLFFKRQRSVFGSLIEIGILILAVFAILATGARGPLLGIVFALVCVFLSLSSEARKRLNLFLKASISLLILLSSIWALSINVDSYQGLDRMVDYITTIGNNTSDHGRIERYSVALDGFLESQGIGVGTGDFASLYGVQGREYPHNLILEIMVEQGVLGVSVLILALWLPFSKAVRELNGGSQELVLNPLIAVWFFALFNSFVSMDISGNHFLWVSGGLIYNLAQSTNYHFKVKCNNEQSHCLSSSASNC